eukprot:763627-Hanusia_phi.AAC.9
MLIHVGKKEEEELEGERDRQRKGSIAAGDVAQELDKFILSMRPQQLVSTDVLRDVFRIRYRVLLTPQLTPNRFPFTAFTEVQEEV